MTPEFMQKYIAFYVCCEGSWEEAIFINLDL